MYMTATHLQFTIMNNMTEAPRATVAIRLFGAFSFLLIATVNMVLNGMLIGVLYSSRKTFSKNAFFNITWQLVICDVITNILEFIIPIPITFGGFDIYGQSLFLYVPCVFETITYNGTLFFSFLMTINRITVFVWPALNRLLFQKYLSMTIGSLWTALLIIIAGWNVTGCYKSFDSSSFHYYFIHMEAEDAPLTHWFNMFFSTTGTYLPIFMFASYIVMIVAIKLMMTYDLTTCRRRQVGILGSDGENGALNLKREFNLLAQAFIICGVLEIENIVFNALPTIKAPDQWGHIMTFVGRWISLVMTSINAIVLFSFNRDIRGRLKELWRGPRGSSTIVVKSQTLSRGNKD